MKIKIWTAIVDGGDGEHHSYTYKSKQELIDNLSIEVDSDYGDEGSGFDEYGYYIQFSSKIFDTDGYEVVE